MVGWGERELLDDETNKGWDGGQGKCSAWFSLLHLID